MNTTQQLQTQQQISCGMMQSPASMHENFESKDTGDYEELGELEHALFMYLEGQDHSSVQEPNQSSGIKTPTLNIFPSHHASEPTEKCEVGLVLSSTAGASSGPSEASMEVVNPRNRAKTVVQQGKDFKPGLKRDGNGKGPTSSSEHEGPKTPDAKALRRLAQNREAARKSRLRKKAYVQQLESSRMKLAQLEQELHRAKSQGVFLSMGDQSIPSTLSSEAAAFDMEYGRWLQEHLRLMCELRAAVQEHLPENELRLFVDNCLVHYNEIISLKSMVAKSDVFHLISGMWKTPVERCFMWIGGFRPSDLIKVLVCHIEPLTEQQIMGVCSLQLSTQEAEDALSQGLEALQQSLSETIGSDALLTCSTADYNMANYMGQMSMALNKLSTLEAFVKQADNLRQQTLHRLRQILTTHQAARCFLAIAEYFRRLRALSSLWLARPGQEK